MSTITIEEMRKVQNFTPWNEWDNSLTTNCIAYALGLQIDDPQQETFKTLLLEKPIEKLTEIFQNLGFIYRRINSESELKDDEYGIVLYDYFYDKTFKICGFEYSVTCEETHLVRIELDRTWTHKFGWDYNTSTTNPDEIHDIILQDDNVDVQPTAYFAVRKPQ